MLKKFADEILDQGKSNYIYGKLLVPKNIELSGNILKWDLEQEVIEKNPDENLIRKFADLANSSPKEVLEFAKTFGVLGLCNHQLPASHSKISILGNPRSNCQPLGEESIDLWYEFAKNAQAILNISLALRLHRRARDEDWLVLLANQKTELPESPRIKQQLIENSINLWLKLSGIRPQLNFEGRDLHLAYPTSNSLFAELANQLVMITGETEGIYTCSECCRSGTWKQLATYRLRKPRRGTKFYCDDCRHDGAPQKHADINYQKKRKQKGKLSK